LDFAESLKIYSEKTTISLKIYFLVDSFKNAENKNEVKYLSALLISRFKLIPRENCIF